MSTVVPPASGASTILLKEAAVQSAQGARLIPGTLLNPPPTVLRLPAATVIAGIVTGQNSDGAILLRTQFGTLTISSRATPASGSQISLQLHDGSPQARPVTVNLPSPASPAGPATAQASAQQARAGAPAGRPATIVAGNQVVAATVTGGPPATTRRDAPVPPVLRPLLGTDDGPPTLRPGSRLTVRVITLQAPTTGRAPTATSAPAAGTPAAGTPTTSPAVATVSTGPPGGAAPAGQSLATGSGEKSAGPAATGRTGAAAPAAPSTQPAAGAAPAAARGTLLPAIVTGSTPAGEPILSTSLGELTLSVRAALAPGSAATLDVIEASAAARPVATTQATAATGVDLSRDWPTLRQALAAMAPANPAVSNNPIESAIPRPGPQFSNDFLFLLAAMRLGDVKGWLGKSTHAALRTRNAALAKRLGDDFGTLTRLSAGATSGDWRAFFVPVYDGRTLSQIRLFTRRQKRSKAEDAGEETATRFIVELELSTLGPIQLDGLSHDDRFDMMVRSHRPLPTTIRQGMAEIFGTVRKRAALAGDIGFRIADAFPESPLEDMAGAHGIGVVV